MMIVLILIVLLLLSAATSGSETALFSLDDGLVTDLRRRPERIGHMIGALLADPGRLLLTILLLNNIINITYFALAARWQGQCDTDLERRLIMFGSLGGLILIGEICPKVIASRAPLRIARLMAAPLSIASLLLRPLLHVLIPLLRRLSGDAVDVHPDTMVTGDELKMVIEQSRDHGVVSNLVHDRLLEVIDLADTAVTAIMTHRVDCCAIAMDYDLASAIQALRDKPSPYILVHDHQEACRGLLTAQDLLRTDRPAKRLRKPLFIPSTLSVAQALQLFQDRNRTVGVVVDEYGGTAGLLGLAHLGDDLLGRGVSEELPDLPPPERLDDHRWRLPGQHSLIGWDELIAAEDRAGCQTLGGFLAKALGAVPQVGDRLLYDNLLFVVEEVDGQRIRRIIVERLGHMAARRMTREGQR